MKRNLLIVVLFCLTAMATLTSCQTNPETPPAPSKYTLAELSSLQKGDFIQTRDCQSYECDGKLLMVVKVICDDKTNISDCGLKATEGPYLPAPTYLPLTYWQKEIRVITRYKDPNWTTMAHLFLNKNL